jgi:hypothetical protein
MQTLSRQYTLARVEIINSISYKQIEQDAKREIVELKTKLFGNDFDNLYKKEEVGETIFLTNFRPIMSPENKHEFQENREKYSELYKRWIKGLNEEQVTATNDYTEARLFGIVIRMSSIPLRIQDEYMKEFYTKEEIQDFKDKKEEIRKEVMEQCRYCDIQENMIIAQAKQDKNRRERLNRKMFRQLELNSGRMKN